MQQVKKTFGSDPMVEVLGELYPTDILDLYSIERERTTHHHVEVVD